MAELWKIFVILVTVLELATTLRPKTDDLPLSRSLGYSMQHKFGTNLGDSKLSQEYLELYQEMMKASQESLEKIREADEDREKDVGRVKMDERKRGTALQDRRHSIHRRRSAIGNRRARSQATRREKLNSQSLRSHQQHIRQSGRLRGEFDTD